jgi:hypothetical protein
MFKTADSPSAIKISIDHFGHLDFEHLKLFRNSDFDMHPKAMDQAPFRGLPDTSGSRGQ